MQQLQLPGFDLPTFGPDDTDAVVSFVDVHGFAIMRGLFDSPTLANLQSDLSLQQDRLVAGELPAKCGTVILDDPDAEIEGVPFAHYVCHATEVSIQAYAAAHHPAIVAAVRGAIGEQAWLLEDDRFGVVYQDARPGARSGYSRIGWHSDAQSGPHLAIWPSIAFTIHLDATSPANGFLRVLPGSHRFGEDTGHGRSGAQGIPAGFERVRGEIAVYAEAGDVLLHHSGLWHSAARATDDGVAGIRRHVRGGWYGGQRLAPGHGVDDFVKNAAR